MTSIYALKARIQVLSKRGSLSVPRFRDILVGPSLTGAEAGIALMDRFEASMKSLSEEGCFPDWD